jgi:hypothetical protein
MRKIAAPRVVAACIAGSGLPAVTIASEDPKLPASDKTRFQVSYAQYGDHFVQLDDANSFGTMAFAGITRNLDGQPWFDRMSERCNRQYHKLYGKQQGANDSCLLASLST